MGSDVSTIRGTYEETSAKKGQEPAASAALQTYDDSRYETGSTEAQ